MTSRWPSASSRDTLVELGEGEGQTYARAYQVLAECAMDSDAREDLQRAAESLPVAAADVGVVLGVRPRPGLPDRPGARRAHAARPLRRGAGPDGQLLAAPDLSDAERAYTLLAEGFVLCNANRLDAAELRFERTADLGYLQDNPRLIAMAAWGMALVAARRSDLPATLRWIVDRREHRPRTATTTSSACRSCCDVAEMLGALGDLDGAAPLPRPARERRRCSPARCCRTTFILDARRGELGDLDAALERTPPAEWWRMKLVAAYAMAAQGDLAGATLRSRMPSASCCRSASATSRRSARGGSTERSSCSAAERGSRRPRRPPAGCAARRSWVGRSSCSTARPSVPSQPATRSGSSA